MEYKCSGLLRWSEFTCATDIYRGGSEKHCDRLLPTRTLDHFNRDIRGAKPFCSRDQTVTSRRNVRKREVAVGVASYNRNDFVILLREKKKASPWDTKFSRSSHQWSSNLNYVRTLNGGNFQRTVINLVVVFITSGALRSIVLPLRHAWLRVSGYHRTEKKNCELQDCRLYLVPIHFAKPKALGAIVHTNGCEGM